MTNSHRNNYRFRFKKNKEMKFRKVPLIYGRSYGRIVGRRSYRLFSDMEQAQTQISKKGKKNFVSFMANAEKGLAAEGSVDAVEHYNF